MSPVHTKVFKSNQSQAVRLPKAVALPDTVKEVVILHQGKGRLIVPAECTWDSWFDGDGVSDDFMTNRDQEADQQRATL